MLITNTKVGDNKETKLLEGKLEQLSIMLIVLKPWPSDLFNLSELTKVYCCQNTYIQGS